MIKGKWKLTNEDYYLQNGKHEPLLPTKVLVFRCENGPNGGLITYFPHTYARVTASGGKTVRNQVPMFENKYLSRQDAVLYDKMRVS